MTGYADRKFHDRFFEKPALSFSNQPNFERFIRCLANIDENFTFVLGAGLSLDSVLPTWRTLISNLTSSVALRWQQPAQSDGSELLRKAESIINLAIENTGRGSEDLIREALYKTKSGYNASPEPGRLTRELAKLIYALNGRAAVATTNYDCIFDKALQSVSEASEQEVTSRPLVSGEDFELFRESWELGRIVLHLHGVLDTKPTKVTGNVILTETDFLRYGPYVKEFIKQRLKDSHVVFIGVSLTDPNLVSPLWDLATNGERLGIDYQEPFLFSVASAHPESSDPTSDRAYEIKRSEYLSSTFGVTTLFFKSYGQQTQAVAEAALAITSPERYIDDQDPARSMRYGYRLKRTLETCYSYIGCESDSEMPVGDNATKLSNKLFDFLHRDHGIIDMLSLIREDQKTANDRQIRETAERFRQCFIDEEFGIFLWLRSRKDTERSAAYELRLVGTSVYQHRSDWSLDRQADVSIGRKYPAVEAAFYGRLSIHDFPEVDDWQLWRSVRAVPFSFYAGLGEAMDPFAALEIGAITLNSTMRSVSGEDGSGEIWPDKSRRSILSTLSISEAARLDAELQQIAKDVIATQL